LVLQRSARPPSPDSQESEEAIVEFDEDETIVNKPPPKANRSRRVGATDLSEVKSEIEDRQRPKN